VILFLHHSYRVSGGEERAVAELARLVRDELGERAELLERDSRALSAAAAAAGLLAGGLAPESVAEAVHRTGARIVHAHNLHPTFGWRALAAAREAGAKVVLHLHQYRLVCAIGVCFRDGAQCTECHGRNTMPGVVHNCRGSRAEALTYATALSLWQRRMVALADAVVVPSAFAGRRLRELGAPITEPFVVPNVVRAAGAPASAPAGERAGALVVSRLAPEKGVDIAIRACAAAGIALTIAGSGPDEEALRRLAATSGSPVTFAGHVDDARLAVLRARARVAVVPSRSAETFGLAAVEAMAAGLPVAASRIGALPEVVPEPWLATPGDPAALATTIVRAADTPDGAALARRRAFEVAAPSAVAPRLAAVYTAVGTDRAS
jgi:glycosyltransferase involved in cell wall biosynthesis